MKAIISGMLKRWYVILLCALIGAAGAYYEKSEVKPSIPSSGSVTYTQLVRFDPVPVFQVGDKGSEVDIGKALGMWGNRRKFIDVLDAEFEPGKINPKWNGLKTSQKFDWMYRHFRVGKIGPGTYEVVVQIGKSEPKDMDYMRENGGRLLEAYTNYVEVASKDVVGDSKMNRFEPYGLIENETEVRKEDLSWKYAVIGFVLGGLLGTVVISVLAIREAHQ